MGFVLYVRTEDVLKGLEAYSSFYGRYLLIKLDLCLLSITYRDGGNLSEHITGSR